MNMAKASSTDLDLAVNIARIIEDLEKGFMPNPDDSEGVAWFDIDDHTDCKIVIDAILDEAKRGSLFRVTFGMLVLCDPQNTLLNPDSDILEPHPLIEEMEQDLQRETSAARYWNKRYHQLVEENNQLRSIVSACADAAGAHCDKSASLDFMGAVPKEVYLVFDKYRSKYQREHIDTNRWKNRAELAEARIETSEKQEPAVYQQMIDHEWCNISKARFIELLGKNHVLRQLCVVPVVPAKQELAIKKAIQFIENGIDFGFIRMPDADCPDSAHDTLPMLKAALANIHSEDKPS